MKRSSIAVFAGLLFAGALAGCTLLQEGETVVKYDPDVPPHTIAAPVTGTYLLYESDDVTPRLQVDVQQGDDLGFREDRETGRIVAVAGGETFPLTGESSHFWREE